MGKTNANMRNAQKENDDEFYTLYEDIAAELVHYKEYFKGKRIICPCDWDESFATELVFYKKEDTYEPNMFCESNGSVKKIKLKETKKNFQRDISLIKCNFIKFLVSHAEEWGIKSISVSGYNPKTEEGVRFQDVDYSKYDVVVTNPPFSLFRDFIDVMFENNMEFLIIGNKNSVLYKNVWPHFRDDEIRLGYTNPKNFMRPNGTISDKVQGLCRWFTSFPVDNKKDPFIFTEYYSKEKHPDVVNYDAIKVRKTKEIPADYYGNMAVPVTFLDYYNPEQFEIVSVSGECAIPIKECVEEDAVYTKGGLSFYTKIGDKKYKREFGALVIKRKKKGDANDED